MKKVLALMLVILSISVFSACGINQPAEREDPEIPEISENPETEKENEQEKSDPETAGRKEVSAENFKNAVEIVLSKNVTVDGKPWRESDCVTVGGEIIYYHEMEKYPSGNLYGEGEKQDMHSEKEAAEHTLVTITRPGEYFIKGELKGQIAVDLGENAKKDPDAKVTIIFGGADIVCEIAPAVIFYNVYECETLSEEASGTVDTSEAGANVVIAEGSISNVKGANVAKIFEDSAEEKKLHKYDSAFYSKMSVNISGDGVLNIEAENEGIGSEMHLTINGGTINIESGDDGINTNEDGVSVTTVNGGKLNIKGGLGIEGDGIDSNGWLVINGGELFASGNERSADGGIDSDCGIIINGGTVFAFGNRNDVISDESAQIFAGFEFAYNEEAGSKISFMDSEGKGFVTESDRRFRSLAVSSPELRENVEYKLYVNGVIQEFSSNTGASGGPSGFGNIVPPEIQKEPEDEIENPYEAPEELDEWLKNEDIPKEIKEWIENMKDVSEHMNPFGNYRPESSKNNDREEKPFEGPQSGNTNTNGLELNEEINVDNTVFVIDGKIRYYSGIIDSSKAMGKERVGFTVNGRSRMEDVFKGDIPEIYSVECTGEVSEENVLISLTYTGTEKNINVSRSCSLSEGYDAVEALFENLETGTYCLRISVNEKDERYNGLSEFDFSVVD